MKNTLMMIVLLTACGSEPVQNGEACEEDLDCESDLCVRSVGDLELPGGLCTQECNIDEPTSCPAGELCLIHFTTGMQHCYQECETDRDCRDEWQCLGLGFFGDAPFACVPLNI